MTNSLEEGQILLKEDDDSKVKIIKPSIRITKTQ